MSSTSENAGGREVASLFDLAEAQKSFLGARLQNWTRRLSVSHVHMPDTLSASTAIAKRSMDLTPPSAAAAQAMLSGQKLNSDQDSLAGDDEVQEDLTGADLLRQMQNTPSRQLDGVSRRVVERIIERPIPPLRILDSASMNDLLKKYQAVSLSIGPYVASPSGVDLRHDLPLLAHEAVHAAQFGRRAAALEDKPNLRRADEREAEHAELITRAKLTSLPHGGKVDHRPVPAAATATLPQPPPIRTGPSVRVPAETTEVRQALPAAMRRAVADRPSAENFTSGAGENSAAGPGIDVSQLKEEMYDYIKDRLRTDFERGG